MKEKPKEIFWFEGQRLLLRRLVNRQQRLMTCITDKNFITNKNLYSIIPKNIDSRVLLGLINSHLLSYLYINQLTQAAKDDFPQVTIRDTLSLPIPSDNKIKEISDELIAYVERSLLLNRKLQSSSQKNEVLDLEIEVVDKAIDQLVYSLYGLNDEEIALLEVER